MKIYTTKLLNLYVKKYLIRRAFARAEVPGSSNDKLTLNLSEEYVASLLDTLVCLLLKIIKNLACR